MINWLLARLGEPSTYAGFAGLAASIGFSSAQYGAITGVVAAIASAVAIFLHEKADL